MPEIQTKYQNASTPDLFLKIADLVYGLYGVDPNSSIFYHASVSRTQLLVLAEQIDHVLRKIDTSKIPKDQRFWRCRWKTCAFGQYATHALHCPGEWWSYDCPLFQTEDGYISTWVNRDRRKKI